MSPARRTKFYGVDSFPEWLSPAGRRFWLDAGEPVLRAEERLRSGEAEDKEVYDLVLTITGDEGQAADALAARASARQQAQIAAAAKR